MRRSDLIRIFKFQLYVKFQKNNEKKINVDKYKKAKQHYAQHLGPT